MLPPLTALLITLTVLQPRMLVSRALEWRGLRWLGRLSYSIYLWQQLFLPMSASINPPPLGLAQKLPLNIGLALLFAIVSHYFVERPLIAVGTRLARQRPHCGQPATADG